MYMVRGSWPPTGAASPEAARAMRVPHEPQNAKFACTTLPQLGHVISAEGAGITGAGAGAERGAATGAATVFASAGPAGNPDASTSVARVGPLLLGTETGGAASGFGGSWNEGGGPNGAGIFGESFQGMPLRGFITGGGVTARSSPAALVSGMLTGGGAGGGGRTVRAVSSSSVESID
jgi:hypothetical protein